MGLKRRDIRQGPTKLSDSKTINLIRSLLLQSLRRIRKIGKESFNDYCDNDSCAVQVGRVGIGHSVRATCTSSQAQL
jgi:hypothetical protein